MTVTFAAIDDPTADLLSLVADQGHVSADHEWALFRSALETVAAITGGTVTPNLMRPRITGQVAPRRIGAFYSRACREGLIRFDGEWEVSDDAAGRNVGKPSKCYAAVAL